MRWIICFFFPILLFSVSLPAAVSLNLGNPSSTEVMLTINLTAPTGVACTVEVATDQAYREIISDVNPGLFTNANKSDRGNGSWIASPSTHYFKVGTRGRAYKGLDGRYYSRVPAAASLLYIRVNNDRACDPGGPATATVTMGTIPYGQMYMDAHPYRPGQPGRHSLAGIARDFADAVHRSANRAAIHPDYGPRRPAFPNKFRSKFRNSLRWHRDLGAIQGRASGDLHGVEQRQIVSAGRSRSIRSAYVREPGLHLRIYSLRIYGLFFTRHSYRVLFGPDVFVGASAEQDAGCVFERERSDLCVPHD